MNQKKDSQPDDVAVAIGEKVQLGVEEGGQAYPTLLEDILYDGRLIISSPQYYGVPLPLHLNQKVQLYFYRENGRYCIYCAVESIYMQEELRLISLQPLSKPIKQQRRESFRLPISLDARLRSLDEDPQTEQKPAEEKDKEDDTQWETTITHNISETGASIRSRRKYQIGDMVNIWMQLEHDSENEQLNLLGTVRQVEKQEVRKKIYHRLGIEFLPYEEKKRRSMARFILKKQQIILKVKRNVDD